MKHLRIVCRTPPQPQSPSGSRVTFYSLVSLADTRVFVVREDGTEEEISDALESVAWRVEGSEPARATLNAAGVEMDVEAVLSPVDEARLSMQSWARKRVREGLSVTLVVDDEVQRWSRCEQKGDDGWRLSTARYERDCWDGKTRVLEAIDRCAAVVP